MKQSRIVFVASTVMALLLISFAIITFNSELVAHRQKEIEYRLREHVDVNIFSFNTQMQEQVKKTTTLADFLGKNWNAERRMHLSLLKAAVRNNGLLRCAIAYPDGSFITHDSKNVGNLSNDEFFIANMKGHFFITDPRSSVVDKSKRVILFAAPIFDDDGKVLGSVIYSYLCDDMDKIFKLQSREGQLELLVSKKNGESLIGASQYLVQEDNIVSKLKSECTHIGHNASTCLKLDDNGGSIVITQENKDDIYVRYDKLNFKDWYMLAVIPEKAAAASIAFAAKTQQNLVITISGILAVYIAILLIMWRLQIKSKDSETGALTIYAFKKQAKKIFANRRSDSFVVVKLDIKDFKLINRIYSFKVGNEVINNMAEALRFVLDDGQSIFARVDVDTFVLLLPYYGRDDLDKKRQKFINSFRKLMHKGFSSKVVFPTGQYLLKASDFPYPDMNDIFEKVNFAHRAAKQRGDTIIDYDDDIERLAMLEKTVEDRMESAILEEEFTLYLQPKVLLKDESICGAEALVRWKVGDAFYMYPSDFIPILEKNGFVIQVDKYMLLCTVRYLRKRMQEGSKLLPISVNFSRHHLSNTNFVKELCEIVDSVGVPRQYIEIELTESAFLGNINTLIPLIDEIHAAGFLISMDDFGSGYSCFAQLKDLKVDILKLDREFFSDSKNQVRAHIVTSGILKIAQELNITTIAEGVEQRDQVIMLKELGCDIVQGYFYAKPMPTNEFDKFKIENKISE